MSAVQLTGHGGLDRLVYRTDVATPSASVGEVLVEVRACALNNTEINTRTGWYDRVVEESVSEELGRSGRKDDAGATWNSTAMSFPRIQGASVAGQIVAVGEGVSSARIGTRVLVDPSVRDASLPRRAQITEYLGGDRDGGFAEYVSVPSENAHAVRSNLSDIELATFPCSYDTAEEMLARTQLDAGETVVVTGAAGGVGTATIQLARARGARVIAIASAPKESRLRALGIDGFVDRQAYDLVAVVADLVGMRGADVVIDVVGGSMFESLLLMLRRGGRYASAGAIGGPISRIDLRELVYKDLEMHGITNPSAETFIRLIGLIESGEIKPLVESVYPLSQLRAAQESMLTRSHIGKIVAVPDRLAEGALKG
ncbi:MULTISPECIES: alcohol dehydrogenase family protein [unclassified Microbacterium]|uniref:alcohol dehydrogenase family protein n=1 Tax=unclassified Microbacterium TaxID=2609290 RepID=UPI003465F8E2